MTNGPGPTDWTEDLAGLRAISIRQPWAWLIATGQKDVENRSRRTHIRGPVLIHAGLNRSDCNPATLAAITKSFDVRLPDQFDFGGIVGVASIVDCQPEQASPWHQPGQFAWVMADAYELTFRPCKGALGFFKADL